ncbi:MAG: response regulator [Phormidesmis sp.]
MTTSQDCGKFSLMELFRLEVETQINHLNHHLLAQEQAGWKSPDCLDELMRAAHSVKGAARIVQVEAAVKVSHALEDYFIAAQQGRLTINSEHVDVLLLGVDLLSQISLLKEAVLSEKLPQYEPNANEIARAIEGLILSAAKVEQTDLTVDDDLTIDEVAAVEVKPAEAAASVEAPGAERMVRIGAENLSRLMGLAGESLIESNGLQPFAASMLQLKRQQRSVISLLENQPGADEALQAMQACYELLSHQLSHLDLFSRRFGQLSDRLYREVIASHMCAFEEGTRGYGRLVRDTARALGKQVALETFGLSTQIDRDILEKLDVPIAHLLTNAIAHGIEPPETRLAAGKPPHGTVHLEAMHRAGMLLIVVEDDGAGIDFVKLRQKIVSKGLTDAAVANKMSEPELSEFLFLPGFSTAARADDLAGRGYGLDLARKMAQSVGGSLQIVPAPLTTKGKQTDGGTRFQFQLPLTLSVVRSLLFEIAGEPYAISLSRIERVLKRSPDQIYYSEGRPYFSLTHEPGKAGATENISLVSASQLLSLASAKKTRRDDQAMSIIVIGEPGDRYGLWVDCLLSESDLVVRPLDARLGKIPHISSAALTETGDPILILDVADVVRSAEKIVRSRQPEAPAVGTSLAEREQGEQPTQKRVLVVDDSLTVRAMEKKLLQNRGYAVDVAINGAEGWNAVRMNRYNLVVTDVDMPRMSGIELITQMRAHPPTQHLPVIIVSYKDRKEDQLAGLKAGADYYLTKSSFHDNGLINAVVDLIGKSTHD